MKFLLTPKFSRRRAMVALTIAVVADSIQLFLGPFGWGFFDEIVDIAAMLAVSSVLGFHLLLLPTFLIEFVPVLDMLPTWTGCVALLIAMRKKEMAALSAPPMIDTSR